MLYRGDVAVEQICITTETSGQARAESLPERMPMLLHQLREALRKRPIPDSLARVSRIGGKIRRRGWVGEARHGTPIYP